MESSQVGILHPLLKGLWLATAAALAALAASRWWRELCGPREP